MPVRALFFDFDGLILDTETPEVEEWRAVFAKHEVPFPHDYFLWAVGRGAEQITDRPIDLLARAVGPQFDRDAVESAYNERRLARIHASPPRQGVLRLLDEAENADLPKYVCSSSLHRWVDGHLDRLGLAHRFLATVCRGDVPRAKPFPDLYLRALEIANVAPHEAIAFEDSYNGLSAARAAGMRVIAVPNPVTAHLDLSDADARYESFEDFTLASVFRLFDEG